MLSRDKALELFKQIYLIRRCEEKIQAEYASDEMKTPMHLHIGAEAIVAGVLTALPQKSKVFGTYRNHAIYLAMTGKIRTFFAELLGRATGCAQGKAGSMHLTSPEDGFPLSSAVVATTIPVAVGAALASDYRNDQQLAVVFFGDGAMEEGAFWESVNFACLKKLRVLFVCEDNELAIHTFKRDRQAFNIDEALKGFDCHLGQASGISPKPVYEATEQILRQMSQDQKPGFLHLDYYRYFAHVGTHEDFDAGYREKPSHETWTKQDPLEHAKQIALEVGAQQSELEKIKKSTDETIFAELEKAKQDPFPGPDAMYEGVLSES
jgi:acetoin:2,6-dichlorophenolindophenol oxidoreductase subunit alpha